MKTKQSEILLTNPRPDTLETYASEAKNKRNIKSIFHCRFENKIKIRTPKTYST